MLETVKNCVREHRTESGVSQEDLATAVGVTRQTIIAIEKGNYVPSVLLSLKLATFFKLPVEKLFSL